MANSQTYINGLGDGGQAEMTSLSQVQGAGLTLPVNSQQFIDTRAPGKLEVLFLNNKNDEVIYNKNKPNDLYLKGLVSSQLRPPFYQNPNQGQKNKINVSRSLPIESAIRDTTRITRFMGSSKGVTFLTKQLLLQGFQPFDETKVYNPASPILASFRLASLGALERPQRFIDTSNLLGGILGATGLGGIVGAVGGLFGATPGTPSPPRSTVASNSSSPKGGLGGFFNISGIFGGGDKTEKVMPATNRGGARGLLRGNTATNAYNGKNYSTLLLPKASGGFFSNLLSAAGSFLKNNTILGGILPPTQPVAGLNYRADEDTYKLMLLSDRWSNFTIQGGDKSKYWDPGVNQGNLLLYSGTQSTSTGGFMGTLLKGLGFNTSRTTNAGSSAVRFYNGGNSSNRLRLYVNKNIGGRTNSKLTTTFDTTQNVGKLDLTDTSKITVESIDNVNQDNISNSSNRYGDVVKVTEDSEYSDQLFNYSIYSDDKLSKNYKGTFSDKETKLVKELNAVFEATKNDIIGGPSGHKYDYSNALGKTQQFSDDQIGFNYLAKVKSTRNNTEGSSSPNKYTYEGRIRENQSIIGIPTRLGKIKDKDRFIRPTNDVDYINSLEVLNQQQFTEQYDNKFSGLGPDFVKFYFYDIVNERFIPFTATIKGLQENNAATWDPVEYLGRPDKLWYYKGFSRDANFSFKVVAHSVKELMPMWQRINYLVGLTRPANYTSTTSGGFMIPPMVQLTLGDFYKGHFVVITSVNIQIPEDASWELLNEDFIKNNDWNFNLGKIYKNMKGKVAQFPREVDISINMNIMEKDRPKTGRAVWGNAPVPVESKATYTDDEVTTKDFNVVDVYNGKDYSNIENNNFSTNVRYDVDIQGQ